MPESFEPEHPHPAVAAVAFGIAIVGDAFVGDAIVGDATVTFEPGTFQPISLEPGGPIVPAGGSTFCAGQPGARLTGIHISRLGGCGRYRQHRIHRQPEQ